MAQQPVAPPERKRLLYGRRRGRPLRTGQRGLVDGLLPQVSLALPDSGTLDTATLFDFPPADIWVEIGFGGGEHLAAQAAAHRDIGMLGCEVFENGIVKLLTEMQRIALTNIRILSDDARLLLAALPAESVGRAFILFPDPWPKMRHHKRRIVSTETLDTLGGLMKDGAELRIATDDLGYLEWMLAVVTTHRDFAWLAEGPADWRERPADWPPTRYEAKAIAAGRRPYFLRLRRRPREART
jgi:tRNA (guanine-N7-)-methyltransferase